MNSSNINQIIKAVLNPLFIYLRKDFARTESTKSTKKDKNAKKAQKRNQAKVQKRK